MTVHGQDWASYQSNTPSTSGLDFAFIKATEGTSYVNPRMVSQAAHARAAGLVVGFYHFIKPGNIKGQASYFVTKAVSQEGDPLFLDWETNGVSSADKDTFIREVQRLRPAHRVGLYCNQDYWLRKDTSGFAGDALWIADYVTAGKPRIKSTWTFHQYTSTPVDTNVGNFANKAALTAWATKSTVPKPPAKPAALPNVSLAAVVYGATHNVQDEKKHPGGAASIKHAQDALIARGRIKKSQLSYGIFDVPTKTAYAAEQRAQGYKGKDADGVPGKASLTKLGSGRFKVVS
ncbi:GH25 family lysozyme [Streptomyces sp. NBC_01267]|uniref:GH25 family lysozyme n=1 Tax=Streptomyces sp. NBC_01267 TaxID=2903805 RepID=UPI002E2F40F2|nr:GH25 family lysozyme [Streptomyces sp. NBC_01267]